MMEWETMQIFTRNVIIISGIVFVFSIIFGLIYRCLRKKEFDKIR